MRAPQGAAAAFRDLLAAFEARGLAFIARGGGSEARPGGQHRFVHGIIDLILHRAVAASLDSSISKPRFRNQIPSRGDASERPRIGNKLAACLIL
jgi:hypothetical protein